MSQKRQYDIILAVLTLAAAIVTILLVNAVFNLAIGNRAEPPPTPAPPPRQSAWDRIRADGVLRVGASADYPPFAYYNDEFQIDGLDIAVIREIGERLGLEVEIKDIVFESLDDAITANQIDVAVGGIAKTPQREGTLGFSDVYFVTEDAILARIDNNPGEIQTVEQLADHRVGVQRGSAYETWLRNRLVDSGLMPPSNLFAYEMAEHAVRDLQLGRVDYVVLDFPTAQISAALPNLDIVGGGLNSQLIAMAMGLSEEALRGQINNILTQLQNEGRLAAIIQTYTNIPPAQLIPIPTPGPTVTPASTVTPPSCVDNMTFVADLNLPDNGMESPPELPPGQPFTKAWRIRNSGACVWDNAYRLVYVGGNVPAAQMGGEPTPINGIVPANAVYDMTVGLVAPAVPGTYQGFWTMQNPNGDLFGDRIWVGITVPGAATATPLPTQTPSPNITFSVDETQITAGECVLFSWDVQNADEAYFYAQGEAWQQNPAAAQGSRSECPPNTITYELRVIKPDSTAEIRQIRIEVQPAIGAPVINRFTLEPPNQIAAGQCVDVRWEVTGTVSEAQITRNDEVVWDQAPVSGVFQDCPPESGSVVYVLTATGPGGTSRLQREINVASATIPAPTATTEATPATPPPIIDAFSANPAVIEAGACVNVSWGISGEATLIQVRRDGDVIVDNAPFSGVVQDCPTQAGTAVYRIDAANNGETVTQEAFVTVQPSTQPVLSLTDTPWQLTAYYDGFGALVGVLDETVVTAVFENDGSLTGSAGCNTYSGIYTTDGEDSITIRDLVVTEQTCRRPSGIMVQEDAFITVLQTATSYRINGNQLELIRPDEEGGSQVLIHFEGP